MKKLAALAVALIAAFVLLPARLAGADLDSSGRLTAAFRHAFATYWNTGDAVFGPGLQRVVGYWFRYLIVKGALAAALLVVSVGLAVLIWRAFRHAHGPRAAALAAGGVLATALGVLSLVTVMANIQSMSVPFASLLPMAVGTPDAASVLAARPGSGALAVITDAYVRYHAVIAVEAAVVVVVLAGVAVALWRWFARADRADRRTRGLLAAYGVFLPVLSMALAVVMVGNLTVVANPLPGLHGLFAGGW